MVPINIRLAPAEMLELFLDCAVEFIVVDDAFKGVIDHVKGKVPSLKRFIYAGDGRLDGCLGYEEMLEHGSPVEDAMRGGDDTFGLFYTGGTTGKPKGVMLTNTNIVVNAMGHVGALNYTAESRYLHSAPMFHLADGASTFGITLVAGSHVFIPKFVPEEMLAAIQKYQVSKGMMVPVMIAMLLQVPNQQDYDCSSLQHIMYGASPMPEALLQPAMQKFPNAQFMQGYGMTETSPAITMLPPECHTVGNPKLRAVGKPVYWVEARIVNDKDEEVPRGTVGQIVTRGPHVMKGYWNMPEKTAEALKGGWMHTEDGGYMDEDGYIFIVDRIKDMIISGGENVYSAEVENAVMKYDGIAMCAVIGLPDPKLGEKVTAVVVPEPGKSIVPADLIAHCRELIGGFKVPREVIVRKELPMSGAGKILKNELRKEFKTDALGNAHARL